MILEQSQIRHPPSTIHHPPPRGMALLMVLLLLSLTLGLSYAAMRSMSTAGLIQRNSDRRASARQAARTGMTMALKKMQRNDWTGVGTSLAGSLSATETFLAAYTAGDATLAADDADQPYRVTLLSTGYAADPDQPQATATYRIRAVVRLVPRKLAPQPSDWPKMKDFTLYQTKKNSTYLNIPCRFAGPARFQHKLHVAYNYPNHDSARERYLSDLNNMRLAGWSDYRPFNGPVTLPQAEQNSKYLNLLKINLGVVVNDVSVQEVAADWIKPTALTNYRIYPGGPLYTVQSVPYSLQSITLEGDPQTNPLGLFYRDGNLDLNGNVTIHGSLFCKDEIRFAGSNVAIEPIALPSLLGTTIPIKLAAASCQSAMIQSTGGGNITGLMTVFDVFQIDYGPDSMTFTLNGKLVASKLYILERDSWVSLNWENYYNWFRFQLSFPNPTTYFPVWMSYYGRNPAPKLTFAPETDPVTYHWATSYDSIFVAHPDDGGLRWDLLSWTENL